MAVHGKPKPRCIKCGGEVRWVTTTLRCLKCGETGIATGWCIWGAGTQDEEIRPFNDERWNNLDKNGEGEARCVQCGGKVVRGPNVLICCECQVTGARTGWCIKDRDTFDEKIVPCEPPETDEPTHTRLRWVAPEEFIQERTPPSALVCSNCGSNFVEVEVDVTVAVEIEGYQLQDREISVLEHLKTINIRCKSCGRRMTRDYTLMLNEAGAMYLGPVEE